MANDILPHIDRKNLHHAYLIEGARDDIFPELLKFVESIDVKTTGNPDFYYISVDNFKIDDGFDLRDMSNKKGFTSGKKIFIVCVNSFTLDAQNVLLKMFEEPIENSHFFLIVPDANALLKTLVSRFYLISTERKLATQSKDAEQFISMTLQNRMDFIKALLLESSTDDGDEIETVEQDSARSKALRFLNSLEFTLHQSAISRNLFDIGCFEHFFRVREFLRMPGSSTKTLMESIALITPFS